jgi:hypothetical protein
MSNPYEKVKIEDLTQWLTTSYLHAVSNKQYIVFEGHALTVGYNHRTQTANVSDYPANIKFQDLHTWPVIKTSATIGAGVDVGESLSNMLSFMTSQIKAKL